MKNTSRSVQNKLISNITEVTILLIVIYVIHFRRILGVGKWCDILVKAILDLFLIGCTVYATSFNQRKRNQLLIVSMFFYAVADAAAAYNVVFSAPLYVIGHLILMAAGALLLIIFRKPINNVLTTQFSVGPSGKAVIIILWLFYMWILWSKLSYSLHNRFYRVSAILFTASDVLAAFRVINILPETPYFDVPCYFLAIMFYAESAFSCEEKEVVTIVDVLDINRRLRKQKLYYCMYGPWAMNLSARRYYRQTSGYHLAYDVTQRDQICALLTKRLGFKLLDDRLPVEAKLYSERYGYLTLHGLWHDDEGYILWLSSNSGGFEMDPEYFHTVHALGNDVPCLFPVDENDEVMSFLHPEEEK